MISVFCTVYNELDEYERLAHAVQPLEYYTLRAMQCVTLCALFSF